MRAGLILYFTLLTLLFVHIQINREFYQDKLVKIDKSFISYNPSLEINTGANNVFVLGQLNTSSLYFNYLRYSSLLILFFLSIREFKKILKSVQSLETFRNDNVKSFRCIGQYVFVYFILSSFYWYQFNEIGFSGFAFSFTPLIIMLFAFILAEIFKEGNLLLEDKELTI